MNLSNIGAHIGANWKKYGLALLILAVVGQAFWIFTRKPTRAEIEDDESYQQKLGENKQLELQNEGLRRERDEAISRAQAKQMEIDRLNGDLQKYQKLTTEGQQKQEEAQKTYEQEMSIIGVDIPKFDRCIRYCDSRAGAGYPCKPNADAYCSKYKQ